MECFNTKITFVKVKKLFKTNNFSLSKKMFFFDSNLIKIL